MAFKRKLLFTISLAFLLTVLALMGATRFFANKDSASLLLSLYTVTEPETAEAFAVGERLHDGVSKAPLGKIVSVKTEPHFEEDKDGALRKSGKSCLFLSVLIEAEQRKDGYYIGKTKLLVGKSLALHGKGAASAICLGIETADAVQAIKKG